MIKRRALAALSVAALSLLSACGGGGSGSGKDPSVEASADEKSDPAVNLQDLVSGSVANATKETTSRFTMKMEMPGPDAEAMVMDATGVVDNASMLMKMTVDVSSMMPGTDGKMDMIFAGDTYYMKMPAELGLGGKWVKMDLKSLSKMAGLDFEAMMDQAKQSDPMGNLGMLAGAKDVSEIGREEVHGVDTRHLKMTVDLTEAVADAPDSLKDSVKKMAEMLGSSSFPAETWIGDDGLPYRVKMTMNIPDAGEAVVSMDLFDYGVDVDVKVPPAELTMDFMEYIGRMAGMNVGS